MERILNINHKIWLENQDGEGILGDGKWELLKLIKSTGSLKKAIDEMGWAYRSTWNKLKKMEDRLGFKLIERTRGGVGGGGQTELTQNGLLIVQYFEELHLQSQHAMKLPINNFLKKINNIIAEIE